jgi:hypothetical protein
MARSKKQSMGRFAVPRDVGGTGWLLSCKFSRSTWDFCETTTAAGKEQAAPEMGLHGRSQDSDVRHRCMASSRCSRRLAARQRAFETHTNLDSWAVGFQLIVKIQLNLLHSECLIPERLVFGVTLQDIGRGSLDLSQGPGNSLKIPRAVIGARYIDGAAEGE